MVKVVSTQYVPDEEKDDTCYGWLNDGVPGERFYECPKIGIFEQREVLTDSKPQNKMNEGES